MRNHRTQGIVLHKRLIGDQDVFATIMTRKFGRLDAMAKSAKKITSKFVGSLDILNLCEFDLYQGPKTWIIRDTAILEQFRNVKTKLEYSKIAHQMVALIHKIAHGADEYSEDFFLLKKALQSLNDEKRTNTPRRIFEQFARDLLTAHGLSERTAHQEIMTPNAQQQYDRVQDF